MWLSMPAMCVCVCACVTGASDCHSGLRRRFPCHGRLLGCDESPVWVWGPGLCHIYRRPLRIHVVSFYFSALFTPSLSLTPFISFHLCYHCFVCFVHAFSLTLRCWLLPSLANFPAFLCWYEAVIKGASLAYFSLRLHVCPMSYWI